MNDPKNTPPNSDESGLPTTPNAQSRAAYFEDMLPGVIASDERDGRLAQAAKRRRSGVPLSIDELRRDLKAVLTQLTVSFMQYEQGFSTFLRTPTHALDYAERVAAYAIKDYPRGFESDADIAGQWDALNSIHVIGYAWRKGEDKTDGKILVSVVDQIASDALMGVYPKHKADETDKVVRVTDQGDGHTDKAAIADKPAAKVYNETTRMDRGVVKALAEAAKAASSVQQLDKDVGSTANQTNREVDQPAPESASPIAQLDTDVGSTANQTSLEVDQPALESASPIAQLDTDVGNTANQMSLEIDRETAKPDNAVEETSPESDKVDSAAAKTDAEEQTDTKDDKIDFSW